MSIVNFVNFWSCDDTKVTRKYMRKKRNRQVTYTHIVTISRWLHQEKKPTDSYVAACHTLTLLIKQNSIFANKFNKPIRIESRKQQQQLIEWKHTLRHNIPDFFNCTYVFIQSHSKYKQGHVRQRNSWLN